jgi:hypothetical protein
MRESLVLLAGFFLAVATSEALLRGTKLQTGLRKVLFSHCIWFALIWVYMMRTDGFSLITLLIFWSGAFLTWFGMRSHVESSILLRMLYLLKQRPMPASDLLHEYESHYSEGARLEELFRGGLLEKKAGESIVTAKGRFIASIASHLK